MRLVEYETARSKSNSPPLSPTPSPIPEPFVIDGQDTFRTIWRLKLLNEKTDPIVIQQMSQVWARLESWARTEIIQYTPMRRPSFRCTCKCNSNVLTWRWVVIGLFSKKISITLTFNNNMIAIFIVILLSVPRNVYKTSQIHVQIKKFSSSQGWTTPLTCLYALIE